MHKSPYKPTLSTVTYLPFCKHTVILLRKILLLQYGSTNCHKTLLNTSHPITKVSVSTKTINNNLELISNAAVMGGRGRYLLVSIEVKCFPNRMQSRYEVFCLFVLSGVSMTNISSKVLIPESNFHSKLVLRKVTPAQYYFEEKYHSEICHSRDCKISYYHHCCHKFMKKSQ